MSTAQPQRGRTLALTGAFFQLGPVISFAVIVISMMRVFATAAGDGGTSDSQQVSANIGQAHIAVAMGVAFSLVGWVLMCVALFASRYRAPWFFWFLVIYGGTLLCSFPVGTGFGIIILAYCFTHKAQFLTAQINPR